MHCCSQANIFKAKGVTSAAPEGDFCQWLERLVVLLVLVYSPSLQGTKRQQVLLIKMHQVPKYPFSSLAAQERKHKCVVIPQAKHSGRGIRKPHTSSMLLFFFISKSQILLLFLKKPSTTNH